jgi:DNA-binding CsgD family transcriptional regulator
VTLYAGLMHSMPIYRLYPAISEPEAIALWWPWGRPAPLVDGGPPRPPTPRRRVLDPSLITATRPQDVVREVMQKTGINRTTAQSMTASMRAQMRERQYQARRLLHEGLTKAEVARRVGLSPSRISALFKGEQFSHNRRTRELLRTLAVNGKR